MSTNTSRVAAVGRLNLGFSFTFKDEIFKTKFMFSTHQSDEEFSEDLKKFLGIEDASNWNITRCKASGEAYAMCQATSDQHKVVIRTLGEEDTTALYLANISHECFHAASRTLRFIQIPLSDDTEEVYSYYQGFIIEQIYKELASKTDICS
jgi:hypothetical protein